MYLTIHLKKIHSRAPAPAINDLLFIMNKQDGFNGKYIYRPAHSVSIIETNIFSGYCLFNVHHCADVEFYFSGMQIDYFPQIYI